jgi:hypothetical protein
VETPLVLNFKENKIMAKNNIEIYTDDLIKEINAFFDDNYPATITFKRGRRKDLAGSRLYSALLKHNWETMEEEKKKMLFETILGGRSEKL